MRQGNFSSSKIHMLMSKGRGNWSLANIGKPFETYVKEKQRERRLKRPLSQEHNAKPTNWGTFVESIAFEVLGLEYSAVSDKKRLYHDELPWCGVPDVIIGKDVVGDIKSPWTLTGFCDLVEIIESQDIEAFKKDKPEYYWQLVSNSILTGCKQAEIITFCPSGCTEDERYDMERKKNHLDMIREKLEGFDGELNPYAFINWSKNEELPYLPLDSGYENIYKFRFEVPEQDKKDLTDRVSMAAKMLEK